MKLHIQAQAQKILDRLHQAGYQAYLVGGCVRDLLIDRIPKDWDIATNAQPEEVQKLFPKHFYDNRFGTVTVLPSKIEVTTFRREASYSDRRHPDKIIFTDSIEEDIKRRDFTINALAYDGKNLLGETDDLKNRVIRAVGNPSDRFQEDALRLARAVRFSCQLGFSIEGETEKAILDHHRLLRYVAKERLKDELIKIIMSHRPSQGIELLRKLKLLKFIVPELEQAVGVEQNKHHYHGRYNTVYAHLLASLEAAGRCKYPLVVRLAAFLHDIGKPHTKAGQGEEATFHGHDIVGAKLTRRILERLKFDRETVRSVTKLVRYHMFLSDPDKVTESGARRLLRRVGKDQIKNLISVRIADRLGSGVPKARPYRLRHFEYLLDKVARDPIDVKMLKVDGNDIMHILQTKPGRRVGLLLRALLNDVMDDPRRNTKVYLTKRVKQLNKLSNQELEQATKDVTDKTEEKELLQKRRFYL